MELREFGGDQWRFFTGFARWADGKPPVFGDGVFQDGTQYRIVFDPAGGWLQAVGWEHFLLKKPFAAQEAALAFARDLGEPQKMEDFLAFGFC